MSQFSNSLTKIKDRWLSFGQREQVKDVSPSTIFDVEVICRRVMITSGIVRCGHGAPVKQIRKWLEKEGLWNDCTEWEKDFLLSKSHRPSQIHEASWKIERLWVFAWALGKISHLDHKENLWPWPRHDVS